MKFLSPAIFCFASFLLAIAFGCHPKNVADKTPYGVSVTGMRKAKKILLKQEEKTIWHFSKNFDPYNGGITTPADPENPVSLEFNADGTFIETEGKIQNKGKWIIEKRNQKLALIYTNQGNFQIPESQQKINLEYQIRKNTPDTLCLAIQGRHGFVEKYYVKSK